MSEKLLEIKDLKVRYVVGKEVSEAVNGISLTLNKGETLGLVGETGAGKTTTALSVMRLLPEKIGKIEQGSIYLDGADITKLTEADMRRDLFTQIRTHNIPLLPEPLQAIDEPLRRPAALATVLRLLIIL